MKGSKTTHILTEAARSFVSDLNVVLTRGAVSAHHMEEGKIADKARSKRFITFLSAGIMSGAFGSIVSGAVG